MINLKQVLINYSERRELTDDEKNIIIQEYGNCRALNLVNFTDKIIADEFKRKNLNIPQGLVYAYVNEIKIKKIA